MQAKQNEIGSKLRDLESKAKMVGLTDLSNLDSLSNASATKQDPKTQGNISAREKLIRDRRIHEQNLVSLRKKLGMELANKRKDIA